MHFCILFISNLRIFYTLISESKGKKNGEKSGKDEKVGRWEVKKKVKRWHGRFFLV